MNLRARHSTITAILCLLIIVSTTVALVWDTTPFLLKNGRSRPGSRSISTTKDLADNDSPAPPGPSLAIDLPRLSFLWEPVLTPAGAVVVVEWFGSSSPRSEVLPNRGPPHAA